jgi:large subunit ribosomal protein L13
LKINLLILLTENRVYISVSTYDFLNYNITKNVIFLINAEKKMNFIQKTFSIKEAEIDKKWYIVNAEGKILGRLASEIATILRGKNKPQFTPHMDAGDNVIVINADKIILSGSKAENKHYFTHSQYPGGEKFINIKKLMKTKPGFVITNAVKGMLPKNRLGRKIIKNLKVYAGINHPHAAQKPIEINL